MPIVSSRIAWDIPQADGRRWLREIHTDDLGGEHVVDVLVQPEWDAAGYLPTRAAAIEADMAAAELAANLSEVLG